MNLRMILAVALLVLILVTLITYGYLVYTLNADTNGKTIVSGKPMLFYSPIVLILFKFITSGLLVYKS